MDSNECSRRGEMSNSSCLTDCSVLNQTTCQPVTRRQMVLSNVSNLRISSHVNRYLAPAKTVLSQGSFVISRIRETNRFSFVPPPTLSDNFRPIFFILEFFSHTSLHIWMKTYSFPMLENIRIYSIYSINIFVIVDLLDQMID